MDAMINAIAEATLVSKCVPQVSGLLLAVGKLR